jgi:hypothetical protein
LLLQAECLRLRSRCNNDDDSSEWETEDDEAADGASSDAMDEDDGRVNV